MRRLVLPLLLVTAAALAGCGNKEAVVRLAETEGIYVDVGELDYQVQLSRQLNPSVVPDRDYLAGLPDYVAPLDAEETWFAVFLRVQNQTDEPHEMAEEFEIEDTTGRVYKPIEVGRDDNPLAYEALDLAPRSIFPPTDSSGSVSPTQGGFLLFKIPFQSLGNRPLEFRIEADGEEAVVDLDV